MKKLLIITDMYPDKYNHVSGVFVKHQVDELAKYYNVQVIATSFSHKLQYEKRQSDKYSVNYIFFPILSSFFLSALISYRLFAIPRIKRIIKEWQPDLIHVHDCRHIPELPNLTSVLKKVKTSTFLTVHNIRTHPSMLGENKLSFLYNWFLNRAYEHWNHIFVVNSSLQNVLSKYIDINQISVVGNAISQTIELHNDIIEKYISSLSPTAFKLISVGNLKVEKGFDLLIESVHKLKSQGIEIQLMIIGAGEEYSKLAALVTRLHLSKEVTFTGSLDNDIVRNLYQYFDAFVLPSYSETFGIVYLEAMYAGLPVIGIKSQGIDGIVKHGYNGLLAQPRSVESLVSELDFIIKNKEKAKQMAQLGMNLVRTEYKLKDLIAKIRKVYGQ